MTLADLIARLEAADPAQVVRHGFTHPHSYRGDYMDLAFEPANDVPVAAMLAAARSALGATFQGYKGGEFTMGEHTWCWLSEEGDASGETISALLLDLMLAPAVPAGQAPATGQTTEVARLHDELLASKAEIAKLRDLLGKENQRANDAITREETAEEAVEEAQQDVRRLGLMVDEYGAGASALTDKLKRVRELHRETCILAKGQVPPTAFTCGLCEVLDAPASVALPASVDRATVLAEVDWIIEHCPEHGCVEPETDVCHCEIADLLRRLAAAPAVVVRRATDETPGARHAPGTAILCPDCRAKGYSVCMDDAAQQPKEARP